LEIDYKGFDNVCYVAKMKHVLKNAKRKPI